MLNLLFMVIYTIHWIATFQHVIPTNSCIRIKVWEIFELTCCRWTPKLHWTSLSRGLPVPKISWKSTSHYPTW